MPLSYNPNTPKNSGQMKANWGHAIHWLLSIINALLLHLQPCTTGDTFIPMHHSSCTSPPWTPSKAEFLHCHKRCPKKDVSQPLQDICMRCNCKLLPRRRWKCLLNLSNARDLLKERMKKEKWGETTKLTFYMHFLKVTRWVHNFEYNSKKGLLNSKIILQCFCIKILLKWFDNIVQKIIKMTKILRNY